MFISAFLVCLALGVAVGFLAGLLGIGGGLIVVPALILLLPALGVSPDVVMPMSLATSLGCIVFTSSAAAFSHHRNGNVPKRLTRNLAVFISLGALAGSFIADGLSSEVLIDIFSVFVIVLAAYMLVSLRLNRKIGPLPSNLIQRSIGLFTGILSSLMGISGGAILVPVLTYCSVSMRHAIGVSSVCGILVAIFGSVGFVIAGMNSSNLPSLSLGYIYLPALLGIVITSSIFAPLGVRFANKLPVDAIKKLFAAFLILVAIELMLK